MADCRPTTKRKTRRKTAPAKPEDSAVAKKPAYLRRKMAVSQPQDPEEQEADKVAKEVARSAPSETPKEGEGPTESREMIASKPVSSARRLLRRVNRAAAAASEPPPEEVSRAKTARSVETEDQEPKGPVQKLRRKEGKEDPDITRIRRKSAPEEQDEGAVSTAKRKKSMSDDEAATEAMTVRRERGGTDAAEQTEKDGEPDAGIEKRIEQARGRGAPLPETVLQDMQAQLGQDLSQVRIHTDDEASALCKELSARAFTVGNDIFFDAGEYAPESDAGRELLAHELTHVVQQDGGQTRRKIAREPTGGGGSTDSPTTSGPVSVTSGEYQGATIDKSAKTLQLPTLNLPALKERNSGLFPTPLEVSQDPRPNTTQTDQFRAHVNAHARNALDSLKTTARAAGASVMSPDGSSGEVFFFTLTANPQFLLFGTPEQLLPRFEIPFWDKQAQPTTFQVDHIREMQLKGSDAPPNYELLEANANMGAGRAIAQEIRNKIKGGLGALKTEHPAAGVPDAGRWSAVKKNYQVSFSALTWNLASDGGAGAGRFWSVGDVTGGLHASMLRPMTSAERMSAGSDGSAAIYASPSGGERLPTVRGPNPAWLPRVDVVSWTPNDDAASPTYGTLVINAYKGGGSKAVSAGPDYPSQTWTVQRIPGMSAGYVSPASYSASIRNSLRLPGMSPIELGDITLSSTGLHADGRVAPTIPLLRDADIRIRLDGAEAVIYKTFSMEEFALPRPFRMDSCDITVTFSNNRGLGVTGRAEFGVERLGDGYVEASGAMSGEFAVEGKFRFDSKLFDESEIGIWYRNERLGARGTVRITDPKKIKGIRSASITAEYNDGSFSANGDVQPDIPGVQRAALTAAYTEEAGLTIGGELQLAPNKAIRSGSVQVTLNKQGEDWKVSATGTAQPNIPGIDSQLTATYDDGAFTVGFSGAYRKGKLAGTVTVGATNRAIGADGTPSGDPTEGRALTVYGSGSATLQIAPWLQGTAGLKLDANGEITISGEIGLPNSVEIFPRKEIEKRLLNVAVQIPIIPGIVAEIGGGLSAKAGVGPGLLEQLKIGVTYNPSREDQTRVTGDAHLRVPADAGLTLGVRAGIGLGITGASATGGLEVTGTLGLQGAAEATVHVEWTPQQGLNLEARLAVSAQPVFTFGVGGYVSVRVLGFSVYDQTWSLASFSFGSDYRFGVALPVRYQEGQPFDISTDDIEFTVPDISPREILSGLIDRIK